MTDINSLTFDALVPTNSQYLAKSDVGEDGLLVTIKGFRQETIKSDDGEESKAVMHFVENVKPMIVNRTNSQLIQVATGAKTAGEARGKKIVVYNDPTVGFGGKITGGLRVRKVQGNPKSAAKPVDERNPPPADEFDDPIPF